MEDVVLLEGHVERPGGFSWREGLHFTDIIRSIDELLPNPDLNSAIIIREKQPTRQIEVKLFRPASAFAAPHGNGDPQLHPRDKIIIFDYESDRSKAVASIVDRLNIQASKSLRRQLVSVQGYVRFPGTYPLTANMNVNDLISLAGGLTDRAFSLGAELTRYKFSADQQQSIEHIQLNLANTAKQPLIEEDRLHINRIPNWIGTESITIEGEVAFPGSYTIQRGETLSQVLKRAGGLNEYAFVEAAVFTREDLRKLEAVRLRELQERLQSDIAATNIEQQDDASRIALADARELLESLNDVKPVGRMVIDLKTIVDNPAQQDIALKDGDSLRIPRYRQSVTVVGEVQFATSHIFEEKLNVFDYVERSGGATQKADEKRIYVVKANGSVYLPEKSNWFNRKTAAVRPGDTVVVPLDADRIKPLTLWTSVSQIFYQIGLGAAAIASF
jgi:protein involved in polysaccharide export with SLBB domain